VPKPEKRLQPSSYHAFRCIGADCEDSCCVGWSVNVDKQTYQAYQRCDDPELGPRLRDLVTINSTSTHDGSYAGITLSGPTCPFLSEGLCGIQSKLGAQYLSIMCATYPRVMNVVDDVLERSLDLSCPEAARIMLLDPEPMEFDEEEGAAHDPRMGQLPLLRTSSETPSKPYRLFREIRGRVIELLQNRDYPLRKRLVMLGLYCDQLQEIGTAEPVHEAPDEYCSEPSPEMVLELIVGRIGSDFTPPRFLACYREFMQGMDWTAQSSMADLARRYKSIYSQHYMPFMSEHEYMLEHYLVSYVHRTLFPLGPQESTRELSVHNAANSIREQCLLLMIHYGIIQTMLVGMAGFHQAAFGTGHVIQLIQSFSKTFEHSLPFPKRALEILAEHGVSSGAGLAILLRNAV
jgi:lysine-N-methylase